MVKHTIHYDIRNIRKAGWTAFADDLLKIMREYWHMKRALRRLKEIRNTPMPLIRETNDVWDDLESKVRL